MYKNRAGAERQAAAAHANGFRGDAADNTTVSTGPVESENVGQIVHRLEPESDDE